jgi:5-methylcytosine-specific restriction protein B
MTIENKYKDWMNRKYGSKAGAPSSYTAALKWLSKVYYKNGKIDHASIFDVSDLYVLSNLYSESIKIQRKQDSYLFNPSAPSQGQKGFYSAALKSYINFLSDVNIASNKGVNSNDYSLKAQLKSSGLNYDNQLTSRFTASLLSKRFLILTGLSGSGKTKLAQAFVKWISPSKEHYELIPVGADWTNREPLLGYPDALDEKRYAKPESGVLDLLMKADKDKAHPYFLILDEMNLSHVERYFADFLSAMESDEAIPLHKSVEDRSDVPSKISIPKNLFIIGTVNIDETTYMFSPKVLDRANVIEFRVSPDEMDGFLKSVAPVDLDKLEGKGVDQAKSFVTLAGAKMSSKDKDKVNPILMTFFNELAKVGAEFGYRSANDIHQLIAKLEHLDPEMKLNAKIDIAVMQKLLPKLHGSRRKLSEVLVTLAGLCATGENPALMKCLDSKEMITTGLTVKYPLSFEKLWRMYRNAVENGYASYAEA